MRIDEISTQLQGYQLHRLILTPKGNPEGTLIFFHGQGDFIDRYPPLLQVFVEQGWKCVLTDLPGHGRSEGKRGHVSGFQFIDAMVDEIPIEGKAAIAGHSMGGMLALRELLRKLELYQFGWFSSPLLSPARQASSLMNILLPFVAQLFPWITRSTGVRTEDCTSGEHNDQPETKPLYHSKISLGWALELFKTAKNLEAQWLNLPRTAPLLFTQGDADPVCPAELLRVRLEKLNGENICYHQIKNALHEPFTGDPADEFRKILKNWILTNP